MKTIKLTLEGESVYIEAIARLLRETLDVREEGKNQRLQWKPDEIRRVLRVGVPEIISLEGEADGSST